MPQANSPKTRRSKSKSKGSRLHVDEDYESDEEYIDHTDTLVAKRYKYHTPRPRSGHRKKNVLKYTGSLKKRPQSAPPNRTGRDLWLASVKSGYTRNHQSTLSPRHKTPTEYFVETLRKTGSGISSESGSMKSMTGLRRRDNANMPYMSTSSYMRQMMGKDKGRVMDDPTVKAMPGTPAYRTQEEYYEQVLELKKQMGNIVQENNTLKAKVRRIEEDNIKKEKEITGLLDPLKSDDIRRTIGEKNPDSASVIHSLKQKIMKLEAQVRDKEASFIKLQSDIKTTKVEELRIEKEVMYEEILRLRNMSEPHIDKSVSSRQVKGGSLKNKALNDAIKSLAKEKDQLIAENRALKEDLQNAFEEKDKDISHKDYEDMNKKELLRTITEYEKKLATSDRRYGDNTSVISYDNRTSGFSGKIHLEGSIQERLDQLDQRETELLKELEKCKNSMKQLKENREHWKSKCEEKDREIRSLRRKHGHGDRMSDVDTYSEKSGFTRSPRQSLRPDSARSRGSVDSVGSDNRRKMVEIQRAHAARSIQQGWKNRKNKMRQKEVEDENEQKAQNFRRNNAARKIQRQWSGYKYNKDQGDIDDATELLQATFRGHSSRRSRLHSYYSDEDDDNGDSYNGAVSTVQSSWKGHMTRKKQMKNYQLPSEDESDSTYQSSSKYSRTPKHRPPSAASGGSYYSQKSGRSRTFANLDSYNYNDDDDIAFK